MSTPKRHIIEQLETYKDLFDNAHDLIHILEPDGRVIYINNAWEKILGYPQEEIEGTSIYSYVDETDRSRFIEYRRNIVEGREVDTTIVVGMISRGGGVVYIEGFVSAKIVDGRTLYTRGIFRDITARLKDEAELRAVNQKLRERENNFQQLLFHAPDAVVVIDTQSRISYWNPKAESIFGWKAAEVLGKNLADVIIPVQYRKAHEEGMKRYLATGEQRVLNKTVEITALNYDRKEFYIALTISSTVHHGMPAFIAFIRDIDGQKKNALELEQKKVQLEISNQELEQFAHVASHDMKEPIRKIMLLVERIQTDNLNALSDRSQHHLDRIEKSAFRLAKMVDGVLAHSSLKGGVLVFERVDLNEIMEGILSDLELSIREKNATFKYSALPVIEGAPFLIFQLFYNLVINSLKFTRAGVSPVIEITASGISRDDIKRHGMDDTVYYYEIVVRDNGIGFHQAHAEQIFESFSRLHSKDRFEGTGLGLSLCRSIVEKHKGLISAQGREGEGASFYIILPEVQQ